MKVASKEYLINIVYKTNILPITSNCNTSCVFCSHKQNPDGVEVFSTGNLNLNDYIELIEYLSPDKKIVIGESATRIIEGEPFLHKDILHILDIIRKKYKKTTIQITTNGILLDEEIINTLVKLENIELNISLNCINDEKRKKILGVKRNHNIKNIFYLLKDKINYTASGVIVPDIIDKTDIEDMVAFLSYNNANSIRFFIQGCTYKATNTFDFYEVYYKFSSLISNLRLKYNIPIVLEPSFIKTLDCKVEGVIKDTPSFRARIKEGDFIEEVDGNKIISRVDAFNKIYKKENPMIRIKRNNASHIIKIEKRKNESSGIIVLYDIDPDIIIDIHRLILRHKAKNVLFMTSELAYDIFKCFLDISQCEFKYNVLKVKNEFFGGTIKCAGLLTVGDVIKAGKEYINKINKPHLIILPPVMFDYMGRDLQGRKIYEIEEELNVSVDIP
ncbi:UNVERIFIED_CONTAM: 4Fe-4S single cluster protein [Acetivibrio alkalicellulosi]